MQLFQLFLINHRKQATKQQQCQNPRPQLPSRLQATDAQPLRGRHPRLEARVAVVGLPHVVPVPERVHAGQGEVGPREGGEGEGDGTDEEAVIGVDVQVILIALQLIVLDQGQRHPPWSGGEVGGGGGGVVRGGVPRLPAVRAHLQEQPQVPSM